MEQAKNWNEIFMNALEDAQYFLDESDGDLGYFIWDNEAREYVGEGEPLCVYSADDILGEIEGSLETKYADDLYDELKEANLPVGNTFGELAKVGEELRNAPENTPEHDFYKSHEAEFDVCDVIANHAGEVDLDKAVIEREAKSKEVGLDKAKDNKKNKDTVERE